MSPLRICRPHLLTLGVIACLSPSGNADAAGLREEAVMKAAVVLGTFDRFARACERGRGFDPRERARIDDWRSAHRVDEVRDVVLALQRDAARRRQVETAVTTVIAQLGTAGKEPCAAAAAVTGTQDARFADQGTDLLPPQPAEATTEGSPAMPPTTEEAPPSAVAADTLAAIHSFGFDSRLVMGVGGFLTTDIHPVVLFRDGTVLTDAAALAFPGGMDAHRQANPGSWSRWRREGGELRIEGEKGWRRLPFQTTYRTLPDGLRLNGLYRRLGGTGNVATGGEASVTAWRDYRFFADGRVVRGGGAGSRAGAGDVAVYARSVSPDRRGRYEVAGIMLRIRYDDGSEERRVLITDPTDPKGALWLDGEGYVQRRK